MMRFFGLSPKDYEGENAVELWPDNVQALTLFDRLATQWRVHAGGAYGLDYGVMDSRIARMNLTPEEHDRLEEDMRVLESAALEAMRESK